MILLATLFAVIPALAVDLTIEFRAGGRCTVTTALDNPRRVRVVDVPAPPPPPSEYRCGISPRPERQAIKLVVTLPRGDTPAGADFPRLEWTERDGQWVGSASLPAAPAFVRVTTKGSAAARRARLLDWAAMAAIVIAVAWSIRYSSQNL